MFVSRVRETNSVRLVTEVPTHLATCRKQWNPLLTLTLDAMFTTLDAHDGLVCLQVSTGKKGD